MEKSSYFFKRKMYIWGSKIIVFPFFSYFPYSLTCSGFGTTIYVVLIQNWRNDHFSISFIIGNIVFYSLCVAAAGFILAVIFKVTAVIVGFVLKLFGESDKIEFVKGKDSKLLRMVIENKEHKRFSGEFKILRINDEKLDMPLLMGIIRGTNVDSQVVVPKGEPVSVGIGLFDDDLGKAHFLDAYKQKRDLNPQTRIYTKLSGNLEDGTENYQRE